MRYISRCRFIRPRRFRPTSRKPRLKAIFFIFLLLFGAYVAFAEWGLSSISESLTRESIKDYLLTSVNESVNKTLANGENSFLSVSKNKAGEVTAASANAEELNRLKIEILKELSAMVNGRVTVLVPMGSLTNVRVFNGRGLPVPLKLNLNGMADVSFSSELVSGGMNQTCHRITMTIRAEAFSQSKQFETKVQTETTTVLSETVIVGGVPNYAAGIIK